MYCPVVRLCCWVGLLLDLATRGAIALLNRSIAAITRKPHSVIILDFCVYAIILRSAVSAKVVSLTTYKESKLKMKINKTLTVFSLCFFAFTSASSFFGEAEAASIRKASIRNDLFSVGAVNDVTLGFGNKVSMVNIMIPGGQPIMCNPVVINPGPPPVVSDIGYKCNGFTLPLASMPSDRVAMITYKTECDKCNLTQAQWSRDGKDVGAAVITNRGIEIKKGSINFTFFNDQPFSLTYQNIQVFEGNNIVNFNLTYSPH